MSERLELTLVRKLEIAHSSGSVPAVVEHASPYQWANACHELWEAGRLDIVEYSARYLHSIYPELTYLSTLVGLFDEVPRHLPELLSFRDDPSVEIQVVRRSDCDAVLLCFCARKGTLGLPLNFVHEWLGRLPVNLIYIKDFSELYGTRGYSSLGRDMRSCVAALRRLAGDIGGKRIYTLGVSHSGGYAALCYGLAVGAESVLSLAGATELPRDFNERLKSASLFDSVEGIRKNAGDLRELYYGMERKPRVLFAFSEEHSTDRQQAERMAGLPNVELIPVSHYSQHNVVHPLIRQGRFLTLLFRLLSATALSTASGQPRHRDGIAVSLRP